MSKDKSAGPGAARRALKDAHANNTDPKRAIDDAELAIILKSDARVREALARFPELKVTIETFAFMLDIGSRALRERKGRPRSTSIDKTVAAPDGSSREKRVPAWTVESILRYQKKREASEERDKDKRSTRLVRLRERKQSEGRAFLAKIQRIINAKSAPADVRLTKKEKDRLNAMIVDGNGHLRGFTAHNDLSDNQLHDIFAGGGGIEMLTLADAVKRIWGSPQARRPWVQAYLALMDAEREEILEVDARTNAIALSEPLGARKPFVRTPL